MIDVVRNVLFFVATVATFETFRALQTRTRKVWQNPLLFSFVVLGAALVVGKVDMRDYREATSPLAILVGPSVVALGLALDARFDALRAHAKVGVVALGVGAGSAVGLARIFGASRAICVSLAPKSATTAIAAPVSERLGGDPSLTAVVVILIGVFGALVGPALLRAIGVRNRYAFGLALGAAAHLVGTSRAKEEGPVEESASAAAMVVHGVLTAGFAWVLRIIDGASSTLYSLQLVKYTVNATGSTLSAIASAAAQGAEEAGRDGTRAGRPLLPGGAVHHSVRGRRSIRVWRV